VSDNSNIEIYVWDGKTITTFPQGAENVTPKWSPDGRLAFVSAKEEEGLRGVYVWDGKMLTDLSDSGSDDRSFAWTNDGRLTFVSARNDSWAIYVWDGVSPLNVLQSPFKQQTFLYAWWTP
jgi:Tol biopolymer transport system component